MVTDEKTKLQRYVERVSHIMKKVKEHQEEIKELLSEASEETGFDKRVLRKAANESLMTNVERGHQALLEEQLEDARNALGLLAHLPLGQAALGDGKELH